MNVTTLDVKMPQSRCPQHLTDRVRDTKCCECNTLFDKQDIRGGVCLWCLYDEKQEMQENVRKTPKLMANDVRNICLRRHAGEKIADLAKCYGVSQAMVKAILYGKRWTHITSAYREVVAS